MIRMTYCMHTYEYRMQKYDSFIDSITHIGCRNKIHSLIQSHVPSHGFECYKNNHCTALFCWQMPHFWTHLNLYFWCALAVFVPILKGKLAANSSITRHFLDKAEIHHGWHHNIRTYIYIYIYLSIYIYSTIIYIYNYVCKLYFS